MYDAKRDLTRFVPCEKRSQRAQSETVPRRSAVACGKVSRKTSMLSMQAFGLPGRLMMSVFPRITDTARESMALGVMAVEALRIASAIPGALRSATDKVASGVISREAKPVVARHDF